MTNKNSNNTLLLLAFTVLLFITVFLLSQYRSLTFEQKIALVETQSESTEVESIERDLNVTDLTDLDAELEAIEKEIDASY